MELQSLGLYVLAGMRRNTQEGTEAGLKYFVLGSLASGLMLLGFSWIFAGAGVTNLADISAIHNHAIHNHAIHNQNPLQGSIQAGEILFVIGLMFKVGCAPFHQWVPDVYQGASTQITAYLAIVTKIAVIGIIIRLYLLLFNAVTQVQNVGMICLFLCSVGSMLVGAFGALKQQSIKRFLGYSGISHIGFILIGTVSSTGLGLIAQALYILIYIIMSVGFFGIILSSRINGKEIKTISQLLGVGALHKFLALSTLIILFSIAGIPPLAGFFSKFLLLGSAVHVNLWILTLVAVTTSVIGTFYYVRFIKEAHFFIPRRCFRFETCFDASFKGNLLSLIVTLSATCCTLTCISLIFFALYPAWLLQFLQVFALLL